MGYFRIFRIAQTMPQIAATQNPPTASMIRYFIGPSIYGYPGEEAVPSILVADPPTTTQPTQYPDSPGRGEVSSEGLGKAEERAQLESQQASRK